MARKQTSDNEQQGRVRSALDVVTTAGSCLLLLAILIGLVVGREWMVEQASALKSKPVELKFDWPPLAVPPGGVLRQAMDGVPNTWLDVKSRRGLEQLVLSRIEADPFDGASLQRAQEALMATGWFDGECRVWREPSGVVRVTGVWREPAAAVRYGDMDYVVSAKGERLPVVYQPNASGLKVVIGPQMGPPKVGEAWIGGDVQAGLSLLAYLRTAPFAHQVAAVDASEYNTRKRLLIVSDRGSTIVWGGEPGKFHPGQAREDEKRARLMRLYKQSGRIDGGEDVRNVSLSSGY